MLSKEVDKLLTYQFNNELFKKFSKNIENKVTKENKKINEIPTAIKEESNFFIANEKDKLFWYYYIIKYGFFSYELLNNNKFIKEKQEKIKIIEEIRNNKHLIKAKKWKINVLESELNGEIPISVSTFLCCCFINNINIILKKNNSIYHEKFNTETVEEVVELNDMEYSLNLNKEKNKEIVKDFLENYYIITNINKPIKAISNYKLNEIQEICKKLKISIKNSEGKKYKKTELYDIIKSKI